MKAEKAFTVIGKKLVKEYKKFRFRYSKKYKYLRKSTAHFVYNIFFSSFFKNIPDKYIELRVVLSIHDRMLLQANQNSISQVFSMNLWEMGNHYNIADVALLNDVFMDLKSKIQDYFIPQIMKLEGKTYD
jgi:hypothetical protein